MLKWYKFGEFVESEEINSETIKDIIYIGKQKKDEFAKIPVLKIANVLGNASKKLQDPNNEIRQKTLELMPNLINFSKQMVLAGLDAICENTKFENIIKRLNIDLEDINYIDEFTYHPKFQGFIKAVPQGITAHISAGNVFVGAIDTLVQGIITKNINILKMSSFDPIFPLLYAQLVKESDPDGVVYPYFTLVPFRGGDKSIEKVLKQESDLLIVYGGKDAVESYRTDRGLFTKQVEYGPKYSCMYLDADTLKTNDLELIARETAKDFTMWEQSACSSPHSIFINDRDLAIEFAYKLKEQFEIKKREFPFPEINNDEKMEITRVRELARVDQALGNSELIIPAVDDQSWTIVIEYTPNFKISCQHRTAFVIVVDDFNQVYEALSGYGKYIQSIGLLADNSKLFEYSSKLTQLGADRITEIGKMSQRKHGTPHDGTRGLAEFVKWVSIGNDMPFVDPFDYRDDEERDAITLAKLNHLIDYSREKSTYFRETLPEDNLKSLKDLSKLPILSQEVFRSKLPPWGDGLLTDKLGESISFGSGGTTGKPKFVFRTLEETRRNAFGIAKGMYLKLFKRGDIVANLFFAGNMWASFISINMALEKIGCHILPIGGHIGLDNIMSYLKVFKVDGIISIPSILISIAEYVEKNNLENFRIPKIGYGGEHLSPAAEEFIKKTLKAEIVGSATYAINDTGMVGYQCEKCTGSVHHIEENLHIVEIVDPDTGEVLPEGEIGNIILTNIDRVLMPVIRYDVGDRGRILAKKCECGRQTRLLELLGRSDEVLIIGGDNISADAISQAISKVEGLSQKFTMFGRYEGHLDLLEVNVECIEEITESERDILAEKLVNYILTEKPALAAFLDAKSIARPRVKVIPPGTLPINPRTGKIKRVVEERYAQ